MIKKIKVTATAKNKKHNEEESIIITEALLRQYISFDYAIEDAKEDLTAQLCKEIEIVPKKPNTLACFNGEARDCEKKFIPEDIKFTIIIDDE